MVGREVKIAAAISAAIKNKSAAVAAATAAYGIANKAHKRMPESEHIILQDELYSYFYARDVIQGRWLEAETSILQNAHTAYWYARDVIQGRWLEAEPVIATSNTYIMLYLLNVIQCRWPEAEPIIMQDSNDALLYALDIIKDRWPEAEQSIAQSCHVDIYIRKFFDEPVITKDKVDIIQWERKKQVGYFAPVRLFEEKYSVLDLMN